MNILYVIPYTPTHIRTRPHHWLKGLVEAGHNVTLATLWEKEEERPVLEEFADIGVKVLSTSISKTRFGLNMLKAFALREPLQAHYSWQPQLVSLLEQELSDSATMPDVIHIEHLRGARYGLWLVDKMNGSTIGVPIVWDAVDSISYLFEQAKVHSRSRISRLISNLELPTTRRFEGKLVSKFDRVLVTSEADKTAMEAAAGQPSKNINVLPNGVALDYFRPGEHPYSRNSIVFTGKMSYHANHTAALYLLEDIMPIVWQKCPDAQVWIVGKDPSDALKEMAHPDPRIHVTGTVPELLPYIQEAAVAVAPMVYGAGIQNKVLEAMACNTPVVASPTAVSALRVEDGEHILVGRTAETFANAILRLMKDTELRQRIASNGQNYVSANHDWQLLVQQLVAIYSEARSYVA